MAGPQIICAGMIVVDVLVEGFAGLPLPGRTGPVTSVTLATGGDAINQATSLKKLGNDVGLMGVVGDDVQGRFVRDRCAAHGISTESVCIDPALPTSTAIVLIKDGGEQSFLGPRLSTRQSLGPDHMNLDLIQPGLRALSIGSLFWSPRFDREAVAPLLKKAKSVGAITIADMVMDESDHGADGLAEAWPYLDFAIPSELEGEVFFGSTEPAAIAADLKRRGVRNVVVKGGSRGVTAYVGDEVVSCPAFNVRPVDTTGAGDNFVAGFIHGLVHGQDITGALRFGSAVAALSIQAIGAGAGLRDIRQVEDFLAKAA